MLSAPALRGRSTWRYATESPLQGPRGRIVNLVFDIGMYDGADSRYYLDEGFRVVAVEANPDLVALAREKFAAELASGQLIVVDAAIAESPGEIELSICADDLGSSTLFEQLIAHRRIARTCRIRATTLADLIGEHGTPYHMKIDIEGADRLCVLALDERHRPEYLSFEVDDHLEELLAHAGRVGYRRFKLIGQCSFLEIGNERGLRARASDRIMRLLGFDEPQRVRRAGRWFELMHSSGPAPWCSDGNWYPAATLLAKWRRAKADGRLMGWYDVHAC
jgi:FkbM family methyltransferase